ncbi:MAG: hypothetical protein HYZ42_17505, partial [Bacteroidetes bacterium]|nr:hypothetical protein [Bacteroidota bacterium]
MSTKLNFKQIITAGAIASGASLIINAILFFIFHALAIITDDIVLQPNQPIRSIAISAPMRFFASFVVAVM